MKLMADNSIDSIVTDPPNGTVLDLFLGSGTTAVAAILVGFEWIGCEMTEDYWPISEARVAWAELQPKTLL
jgi:site-specific DNA-methyltransferase (adenine-specific)